MNIILSLEAKLAPCSKCGGKAIIKTFTQSRDGFNDIDIECEQCGLMMGYQYYPYDSVPVRITWICDVKDYLSVADAWKSYGSDRK